MDPTSEQWQVIRRQWGGRRYAYNWAVRTLKADLEAYHAGTPPSSAWWGPRVGSPRATGESKELPSFSGLRWRWNREKATECLDRETGEAWWPQISKGPPRSLLREVPSKEAFANGIKDAVDAYWRWQQSRAGKLDGRRVGGAPRSRLGDATGTRSDGKPLRGDPVGFPRFKRKGRDSDRCTFSTGPLRVEPDRRHVTLPRIGTVRTCENTRRLELERLWFVVPQPPTVRTCENTRRLERLIRLGRARILAATLKRVGERAIVVFRVEVQRPQGQPPAWPP